MTKAAMLISAVLLFAGVAAAGSLTSSGGSNDTPTLSTPTATPQETSTQTQDVSGPCDETEHANDPRCASATGAERRDDDRSEDHRNSGPGKGEDSSGPGSSNSGPGGRGHDD